MTLVYCFETDITEIVSVGLVPEGIRPDVFFSGHIVGGSLSDASLHGIDYFLLRSDGIGVLDAHEVVTSNTGVHISLHAQGYITPLPEIQLPHNTLRNTHPF